MKGLVIREPWIDLILNGKKTWELRTQRTTIRGQIALIRKGSGQIAAVAELVDSLAPLDAASLAESVSFHGVPLSEHAGVIENDWLFPWLIVNTRRLSSPVPYAHPAGAVTWVNLDETVARAVDRAEKLEFGKASYSGLEVSPPRRRPLSGSLATPRKVTEAPPALTSEAAAKISPALEAELIATAGRLGVRVKTLGSANAKMRQFTVSTMAEERIIMVNRVPQSSPEFQLFLSPKVDGTFASIVGAVPGVRRYENQRSGDFRLRHSAFRAFGEPRTDREPFGHGWILRECNAAEQFASIIEIIRT